MNYGVINGVMLCILNMHVMVAEHYVLSGLVHAG